MKLPFLLVSALSRSRRLKRIFGDNSIERGAERLGLNWRDPLGGGALVSDYSVVAIYASAHDPDSGRYYASRQLSALNGDIGVQWHVPWAW